MRFCNFTPALAMMLLLSACGGSQEDNQATETRMDSLDSLEGTISDDMINTDEAVDDVPVQPGADVSVPDASKDAAPVKTGTADTATVEISGEPK
ncbi:hypothetical protein [Sphingorhabdus sp.]|jgi:hypothetical protein|uniref:hypothetical protein n=1 Tax=Sphingorhabdus sp. TaxID=1902408 RepID=UPI0037836ED9